MKVKEAYDNIAPLIYKKYGTLCYRIGKDEADNLIMYALFKAIKTYDESKNIKFNSYAYTIIKNELLQRHRYIMKVGLINCISLEKPANENEDILIGDIIPNWEDPMRYESTYNKLLKFIDTLNDKDKTLMCFLLDGWTVNDIAKYLGVTRSAIHRRRSNLKEKYKKFGGIYYD